MHHFTITAPGPADAERLARVQVKAWREAYGELLPERFYDETVLAHRRTQWSRMLAEPELVDRLRIARIDGRPVGFAFRGPARDDQAPRELELCSLYVLADHYGTGMGAALLTAVLGDHPAMLWVARDNARARRFYEKHGFRADGAEKADPTLEGLIEVRMVR